MTNIESDIISAKREINGEVSGNQGQQAQQVVYMPTTVGRVVDAIPERRPPGRPKGSKTSPEKIGRAQRERDRERIREERAFEVEREQTERQYEIERARREAEFERERKALEGEAKRVTPRDPLRAWVLYSTLALALLILVASGIFSFATIADAAEWLRPAWPGLVWLLPIATEFFIVFGGMDTLISQARGDRRGARTGLWIMISASLVAVIANGAHTLSEWEQSGGLGDWRAWVGIGLSALIPIATVVASKRAINLVFAKGGD